MIARTATLLCLAAALTGVAGVVLSTRRIERLKTEVASVEATSRAEGDSFVRTLQGAHAERQLQAYDRRRELAIKLADARRDRFLALLGAAGAALGASAIAALRRMARELEEDRRLLEQARGAAARERP